MSEEINIDDMTKAELVAFVKKGEMDKLLKEARINPQKERTPMFTVADVKSLDQQFKILKGLAKIPLDKGVDE